MWIHSIKLKNFKSYAQAEFTFPEPRKGKNLVVIGAQNGHGKTTLLEAIYLCLYDKDAIVHFQRAGLNSEAHSYPKFLKSALHHEAQAQYGLYQMTLEIEIRRYIQGKIVGLHVCRKWFFDSKKEFDSLETRIHLVRDNERIPVKEEKNGQYIYSLALPFDYAPFFFFDGEKIVTTAKESGAGVWLNVALHGLLGVTLLNKLQESLKKYRTQCISKNASQKALDDLNQAERDLQSAEVQLDICREEYEQLLKEHKKWEDRCDDLLKQLGKGSDIHTTKDLIEEQQKLRQQCEAFEGKIKEAVLAMPLAFLPHEKLTQLQRQLSAEANRLHHEAGKEQIADRVEDFWREFTQNDRVKGALGSLGSVILNEPALKEAVAECWDKLFYPLPDNCAESIQHNYLSKEAHAEIQNQFNQLGGLPVETKIGDLLEHITQYEEEAKQVTAKIDALKGTNNDELVEKLKEAQQKSAEAASKTSYLKANYEQQQLTRRRLQNEISRLQDEVDSNNPKLTKSKRAKQIEEMIDRLKEALLKEKVEILAQTATRMNQAIAHDARIGQIRIDDHGRLRLFGRDGHETQVDLSAGQMQILIMSLISALAEITHYQAPFVIDTPLARLDSEHRQGLFEHWKGLSQQVILLSQDAEVTPEIWKSLSSHVNKTYLVQAESLKTAGASSKVIENTYFK